MRCGGNPPRTGSSGVDKRSIDRSDREERPDETRQSTGRERPRERDRAGARREATPFECTPAREKSPGSIHLSLDYLSVTDRGPGTHFRRLGATPGPSGSLATCPCIGKALSVTMV